MILIGGSISSVGVSLCAVTCCRLWWTFCEKLQCWRKKTKNRDWQIKTDNSTFFALTYLGDSVYSSERRENIAETEFRAHNVAWDHTLFVVIEEQAAKMAMSKSRAAQLREEEESKEWKRQRRKMIECMLIGFLSLFCCFRFCWHIVQKDLDFEQRRSPEKNGKLLLWVGLSCDVVTTVHGYSANLSWINSE